MFEIEPDRASLFAEATRLSRTEVFNLTYKGLRHNYPPVDPAGYPAFPRGSIRCVLASETWVFIAASRFCPHCLRGDGSPIQEEHGGAWNKYWRLAPVFACLKHRQLLEHRCPVCGLPAMANNPRYFGQLVPLANVPGLHPLCCRSAGEDIDSTCRGRYDQLPHRRRQTSLVGDELEFLLDLQSRFTALLAHTDPGPASRSTSIGRPVTPAAYFTDLRIVSVMINRALRLSPTADIPLVNPQRYGNFVAEMHAYIGQTARQAGESPRQANGATSLGTASSVPLDPAACTSLFALAADLLDAPQPKDMAKRVVALAGPGLDARRTLSNWARADMPCSTGMREAIALAYSVDHKVVLAMSKRSALNPLSEDPSVEPKFRAANVPQRALDRWWERHFAGTPHADVRYERNLRLYVSATLASAAEGCPLSDAAELLGMPVETCIRSSTSAARAMDASEHDRFRGAIDDVIRELNDQVHRIDYGIRRRCMRHWELEPGAWAAMLDDLPGFAKMDRSARDDKRLLASVLIWTRVTRGDYLLAPLITPLTDPMAGLPRHPKRRYVRNAFGTLAPPALNSAHDQLAARLREHADRLIADIIASPESASVNDS